MAFPLPAGRQAYLYILQSIPNYIIELSPCQRKRIEHSQRVVADWRPLPARKPPNIPLAGYEVDERGRGQSADSLPAGRQGPAG